MPQDLSIVLPISPLNWTSIAHYLILVGALVMLLASGDKAPMGFIFILLALALLTAASLYIDRLAVDRLWVFLIRVGVLGIPLILIGLGPTEQTRQVALVISLIAIPIMVSTLLGCRFPILVDPRLAGWC
ncbi:MAG: hypothetical protein Kow00124_14920 [Anaerolineae bacterium]